MTAKRHHYLPMCYLKGFCREGGVCVYDKKKQEYRRQQPINTALVSKLYTFVDAQGEENTEFEQILSGIEGKVTPILRKLENQEEIVLDEKEMVALFVGLLASRVPAFRKNQSEFNDRVIRAAGKELLDTEEKVAALQAECRTKTGEAFPVTPKELLDFIQGGEYKIETHANVLIRSSINTGIKIAEEIRMQEWASCHASQGTSFLTSDNPFVVLSPPVTRRKSIDESAGLFAEGVQKIIPLSQQIALVIFDNGNRMAYSTVTEDQVEFINTLTVKNSDRFVIGADESLLKDVVEQVYGSPSP